MANTPEASVELLDEPFNAFNAHDLDRFMAFVAEDCVLQMQKVANDGVLNLLERRQLDVASPHA